MSRMAISLVKPFVSILTPSWKEKSPAASTKEIRSCQSDKHAWIGRAGTVRLRGTRSTETAIRLQFSLNSRHEIDPEDWMFSSRIIISQLHVLLVKKLGWWVMVTAGRVTSDLYYNSLWL
jgi:hypothetical protein